MLITMLFPVLFVTFTTSTMATRAEADDQPVISINNGASVTNSRFVTLNINYTGEAVLMQFSTDNVKWGYWTTFRKTVTSFALTPGNGVKRVYVRFKDSSSNISSVYSDQITLDTSKPIYTISINSGATATNSDKVTVTFEPVIPGSGIASYCLGNTAITDCSVWVAFNANAATVDWTLIRLNGWC